MTNYRELQFIKELAVHANRIIRESTILDERIKYERIEWNNCTVEAFKNGYLTYVEALLSINA